MTVKIWYKVEELEEASINFEQNKTVNNLKRAIIKNEPILNGLSSSKITLKITKEGDNKIYIVSPRWVIQKVLQEIGNNFLCLIHKKGYYANGPDVTFVAICRPLPTNDSPEVAIIVNSNLNMRRNQIFNLRRMINLSILIKSLQDVIGWHETPEFRPIVRRVEKLKNVYNILTKKKVPNVDLLLHANNGSDEVYLGLKGMSVRPNNQKELLEAVVCVLEALVVLHGGNEPIFHQDIQWPNIIKLPGELLKWILIDWDDTDRPLTRPANHLGRDNHTPEVFEEDHGGEVDIWSIGRLIIEVNKWIMGLSQSIVDIGVTIQSNNRPNAHDALEF
ncbi:8817_t:CDS:2, partial [Funneliformis geosporum]